MIAKLTLAAGFVAIAFPAFAQDPAHHAGEDAVAAYAPSDANASAAPFAGTEMLEAFHGQPGIDRIVDDMLDRSIVDSRTAPVFARTDMVRLRRTLKEQFCYILNGPCQYTGRSMAQAHANLGLQAADMGALVENLQTAMANEGVPFHTQNRFLARLAPMRRDVVTR